MERRARSARLFLFASTPYAIRDPFRIIPAEKFAIPLRSDDVTGLTTPGAADTAKSSGATGRTARNPTYGGYHGRRRCSSAEHRCRQSLCPRGAEAPSATGLAAHRRTFAPDRADPQHGIFQAVRSPIRLAALPAPSFRRREARAGPRCQSAVPPGVACVAAGTGPQSAWPWPDTAVGAPRRQPFLHRSRRLHRSGPGRHSRLPLHLGAGLPRLGQALQHHAAHAADCRQRFIREGQRHRHGVVLLRPRRRGRGRRGDGVPAADGAGRRLHLRPLRRRRGDLAPGL